MVGHDGRHLSLTLVVALHATRVGEAVTSIGENKE
jgi:hypothetical protein